MSRIIRRKSLSAFDKFFHVKLPGQVTGTSEDVEWFIYLRTFPSIPTADNSIS